MTLDRAIKQIIPTMVKHCDNTVCRIVLKCGVKDHFLVYPRNHTRFDKFNIEMYSDEDSLIRDVELVPIHRDRMTLNEMLSNNWIIEIEKKITVGNFVKFSY